MPSPGFKRLPAFFFVLGCSLAGARSTFAQVSADAYAAPDERVELPSAQSATLYREVLKHYRPSGNRMRLLNPSLLPSSPEQESGGTIQQDVAEEIVASLGNHFCATESRRTCNGRNSGGELRVSPVYHQADNRVRVAVQYASMEPYGPANVSTQVFWLEQARGKWVIRDRR